MGGELIGHTWKGDYFLGALKSLSPSQTHCRGLPTRFYVFRTLIGKQNRSPATGLREDLKKKGLSLAGGGGVGGGGGQPRP